ncbi:TolC family protein [Persicobacter psychrovividus]
MRLLMMIALCLMPFLGRGQGSTSLNLQQCIDIALQNNQAINKSEASVRESQYKVKETIAIGLPQVNGQVTANNNFALRTSFITGDFLGGSDPNAPPSASPSDQITPISFGTSYDANATLSVSQLIFDGSFFVGLEAAKTYVDLAQKDLIRAEIDVVESVKKAYYLVLINKERLRLVEQNLGRLDTLLNETQLMFDEGFAEKIDVDRIRVSYNNIKSSLKSSQRMIELSQRLLSFHMGVNVNAPVVVEEHISDIAFDPSILDADLAFKSSDRVEMQLLGVQEDLAKYELKNIHVQYLPNLYAVGNMGYLTGANTIGGLTKFGTQWFGFGTIGVQLSIPIFDGLMKRQKAQQVRMRLEQLEYDQQQTAMAIDNEVFQSKANLLSAIDQLTFEKENMTLAKDVFETTRLKYQEGIGSNIELVDANNSYITAQVNYFNAYYDALLNKVNLEKSVGQLYRRGL